MANRLNLTLRFDAENGDYRPGVVNFRNEQVTLNALGADSRIVSVGTSEQDIAFSVATHGYLLLRNLDAANYLAYGPKSAGAMVVFGRLKPGEFAVLRVEPGITFRAVADTAACDLWIRMEND